MATKEVLDVGLPEVEESLRRLCKWTCQLLRVVEELRRLEESRLSEPLRVPLERSEEVPPPGEPCGDGTAN